jgi:hypothetical protein
MAHQELYSRQHLASSCLWQRILYFFHL